MKKLCKSAITVPSLLHCSALMKCFEILKVQGSIRSIWCSTANMWARYDRLFVWYAQITKWVLWAQNYSHFNFYNSITCDCLANVIQQRWITEHMKWKVFHGMCSSATYFRNSCRIKYITAHAAANISLMTVSHTVQGCETSFYSQRFIFYQGVYTSWQSCKLTVGV